MASINLFAGSVPANYDKYLGPILFEPYALDLAERLKNDQVNHVLELACGTGRVTKHLVEIISENGSLIASDLNPGMLDVARAKLQNNKIIWEVADAQNLPFDDNRFDHIVCQFGVMFFADKEKSFKEANRILIPGGKFIFNTWESLEKNPRIDLMWKVMHEVFGNEAPDFLQKGPYSFYDTSIIEQLLLNTGFTNIQIESVAKTTEYNEPDDLIKGFADGSPLSNYLQEKKESVQAIFKNKMKKRLTEQDKKFGKSVSSLALVVEATK